MSTEISQKERFGGTLVIKSASVAVIAALAFGLGVVVGGTPETVIARIPIIGDGLDATPDQRVDLSDFWKAWNTLNAHYVVTHASTTLPSVKERMFGAISGLAASYTDPYTVFFPPEEAKKFADIIAGSFGGVGMELDIKNNVLTVVAPLKGTPAEKAGMRSGDTILMINGESTEGLSTDAAVSKIRGEVGTAVDLVVGRNGTQVHVSIVRDTIQVPETDDSYDADTGVYRIALYQFSANSAVLFSQAFERFKASGSKKLLLDFRANPGGYLDAAVDIASHFLPKGATVVTEDYSGKQDSIVHTSLGYNDVPVGTRIAFLIDGGSASASEILAGALQDAHVATLIGSKSFGKGSVQSLFDLDGGSLKVTVARWITPAGHWIMGNGITPDISVPFTADDAKNKSDPQKARAIKFLTTGK